MSATPRHPEAPPDTDTWGEAVTLGFFGERTDPFPDSIYVPGFDESAAPAVDGVTPATGAAAGGETVTVDGDHFYAVSEVTFGGAPATSIDTPDDGGSLTCVTPPGTGAADVAVVTPAGTGTLAGGFTYAAAEE